MNAFYCISKFRPLGQIFGSLPSFDSEEKREQIIIYYSRGLKWKLHSPFSQSLSGIRIITKSCNPRDPILAEASPSFNHICVFAWNHVGETARVNPARRTLSSSSSWLHSASSSQGAIIIIVSATLTIVTAGVSLLRHV